jgi:hypothetical protein
MGRWREYVGLLTITEEHNITATAAAAAAATSLVCLNYSFVDNRTNNSHHSPAARRSAV